MDQQGSGLPGVQYVPGGRWQGDRQRASTTARGYGYRHRQLRAELLPLAYGRPCNRCGRLMEMGQPLDLDHTDDRRGYRGFAHAHCNRAARRAPAPPTADDPRPRPATQW